MPIARHDASEARAIANRYAELLPIPFKVSRPFNSWDTIQRVVGGSSVPRLIPGLKAQPGQAKLGTGKRLGRTELLHARAGPPDPRGSMTLRSINQGHTADPSPAQREC